MLKLRNVDRGDIHSYAVTGSESKVSGLWKDNAEVQTYKKGSFHLALVPLRLNLRLERHANRGRV